MWRIACALLPLSRDGYTAICRLVLIQTSSRLRIEEPTHRETSVSARPLAFERRSCAQHKGLRTRRNRYKQGASRHSLCSLKSFELLNRRSDPLNPRGCRLYGSRIFCLIFLQNRLTYNAVSSIMYLVKSRFDKFRFDNPFFEVCYVHRS